VKDPDTGTIKRVLRDEREWVVKEMKNLRILDEALWQRVKARRLAVGQAVAALREALHSRARSTGRNPKYLFSGLLVCGHCGSNFVVVDPAYYGCTKRRSRGEAVCSNDLKASRKLVELLLLKSIQDDLFTEEGLAVFKQEFERYLVEQHKTKTPEKGQAKARLTEVEREISNIMVAIKAGILTPTTKAELEKLEAERTRLLQI